MTNYRVFHDGSMTNYNDPNQFQTKITDLTFFELTDDNVWDFVYEKGFTGVRYICAITETSQTLMPCPDRYKKQFGFYGEQKLLDNQIKKDGKIITFFLGMLVGNVLSWTVFLVIMYLVKNHIL